MQFLSQNSDHHFTSYSLKSPELTLADKILAKGILTSYPQFKCIEIDDITVDLLGDVTQRSNPYGLDVPDQLFIEEKILGMFYKFYRRCLSGRFEEKLTLDTFVRYTVHRDVNFVEPMDLTRFLDGRQSLVEDKSHLLV